MWNVKYKGLVLATFVFRDDALEYSIQRVERTGNKWEDYQTIFVD